MANWKDGLVLKVVNILLFLDFVYINVYCFIHHLHGHGDPSHFGAATKTFAVWTFIQAFLIGTLLYQFTERGKTVIIDGLPWQFPSLLVLTMAYFIVWINKLYPVAFIVAIHLSILVTYIYFIVKKQYPARNIRDEVVIHVTFSLYHAWTSYILIKAAFDAFEISTYYHQFIYAPNSAVVIALIALQALSAMYAFSSPSDFIGPVVITWAMYGVSLRQDGFYSRAAWVSTIISLVWVGKAAWGLRHRKYSEAGEEIEVTEGEQEPLLGSA